MWVSDMEEEKLRAAFGIDMASIGKHGTRNGNNVFAAYGVVRPGQTSTHHRHDEAELFVVVSGEGQIIADDGAHTVRAGSVVFSEPFDAHVLRNTGNDDLRFATFYWRDDRTRAARAHTQALDRLSGKPVFVFSTPPTPNGDLHLGHLSGPYLGADVYVRYLRANGVTAYHLTGSDDYQSYVVNRARAEERTPAEVAAHYANEIRTTLEMMDIPLDQYTVTSQDETYARGLQGFFSRLVAAGVRPTRRAALFDGESGAYLYEADVSGACPTCGEPSGGNICEQCGEPNTCVEFADPRSKLSSSVPMIGEIERYSLCLSEFRAVLEEHHRHSAISPRLRELARKVLSREDFVVPITHPANWGVPPIEATEGDQVIWVWPEMAYGFLHGIEQLGKRLGHSWRADHPEDDWKIVHFFGYDNSFYHSILYPVLYHLAFPGWEYNIDYNENEFYLLDGLKFSTSRRHAVWGKEVLRSDTVDAVRYYLAWTRGEQRQTNFTMTEFRHAVEEKLIGRWQRWLKELGGRINDDFENRAPEAGAWAPRHIGYQRALDARFTAIESCYDGNRFSLNGLVDELNALVELALRFGAENERIRFDSALHDEYRTAIALELATARLLAQTAAPLMPRFSARLADSLGGDDLMQWPSTIQMVRSGSRISLANRTFFPATAMEAITNAPCDERLSKNDQQ